MNEREEALNQALKLIEKEYGKGSVMKLGAEPEKIEVISSGSISLDKALGVGGYPKGRIIEIYGPESSGKTTFALHAIANAQKNGGFAAFFDAEHALDPVYAKNLGVDVDAEHSLDPQYASKLGVNINELLLSQPDNGEQALEIAEALIKSGSIDVLVVDSVAALVPEAELNGDMGDSHVGLHARLMSQAMRKLSGIISKTKCVAIFINQIREKVGVMFGNPETTTGGRALKFYSSVRLEIRRGEQIKDGTSAIGNRTTIKVVKNKVAPPFRTCEVEIIYGQGISHLGEIVDLATKMGLIEKSGSWFSYNGEKIGQGREKVKDYLKNHEDICNEIEAKIREA